MIRFLGRRKLNPRINGRALSGRRSPWSPLQAQQSLRKVLSVNNTIHCTCSIYVTSLHFTLGIPHTEAKPKPPILSASTGASVMLRHSHYVREFDNKPSQPEPTGRIIAPISEILAAGTFSLSTEVNTWPLPCPALQLQKWIILRIELKKASQPTQFRHCSLKQAKIIRYSLFISPSLLLLTLGSTTHSRTFSYSE